MNKEHRSILIALTIGDGYIRKRKESCEIRISHSIKQNELIEYKAKLLHKILGGKEPKICYHEQGRIHPSLSISKTDSYFRILRKKLYKGNQKFISRSILDCLNPIGLAIWWMDDGTLTAIRRISTKTGELRTASYQGFIYTYCSFEEAQTIQQWFREVYDIETNIRKKITKTRGLRYNIQFNTANMRKLIPIIEPYVLDSMKYKITMDKTRVCDNLLG